MIGSLLRICGCMVILATLVLPAQEPLSPEPTPPEGEREEGGEEEWRRMQDMVQVEGAMRIAQAENLYLEARARYQRAYFVEARELVERALEVFPAHSGAQELREDILGILAVRSDRLRMMARWLGTLGEVAVQEQAVRLAGLIEQGDRAMLARDFLAAARYYDRVAIGIRTFPYRFDWGNLPEEIQTKIFNAQSEARLDDLNRLEIARRDAAMRAQEERQREQALLRAKVDTILSRARRHYVRRDFRRAAVEAWNAYELDRRREDARRLYLDARRHSHRQFEDYIAQELPEREERVYQEIHRNLIPQNDLMVYPANWFEINMRRPEELGERREEGWQRELRDRLEQEVEFIWEDTMLDDAIEFLRRTTGVNFVISQEAMAAGVPPITLSGRMRLRTVLNWISQITRLEYTLRAQAVWISTDVAESNTTLRVYNVNDLLSPVRDFEGPQLGWAGSGGGGGGGGGGMGFDLFGPAGGGDEGLDIGEIQELIETSVAPDTWMNPGVAIEIRQGGTLFINQTPDVHEQVAELLRNLRAQASLQVNVRIRVLDLTKSFIEEIGVEFQDLTDASLLGSTTSQGFSRIGREWLSTGRTLHSMPGQSMQSAFNVRDAGLRLEGAFNLTNTFNAPQLNVLLEAMQQEADGIILNAPEVTAFNGQQANAQFMHQIAYISDYNVEAGTWAPQINILNVGDIIEVRPLVSADRKYVTLEISPTSVILEDIFTEFINVITTIADAPVVLSYPLELPNVEMRLLRTTAMLPDKGSLMLGGYTRGLRQRTHAGIPFLSHIPFLGRLFSKDGIYDENRHLMFLVTVTILDIDEIEALQ